MLNDEQLIALISTGDEEAFGQLYRNTDRALFGYILSLLGNPQDAEEVMQETYLKIWTCAASYRPQGKPLAWMLTIAKNLCYMRFRERKHQSDLGLEDLPEGELGEMCSQVETAPERMVLTAALELLKEEERQIVLLHAAGGLKHREIASSLGMPLATVLSKYSRAMKKLERYLRQD